MNDTTEMYSAIEAEVPVPTDPLTQTNFEFLSDLKNCKKVKWLSIKWHFDL